MLLPLLSSIPSALVLPSNILISLESSLQGLSPDIHHDHSLFTSPWFIDTPLISTLEILVSPVSVECLLPYLSDFLVVMGDSKAFMTGDLIRKDNTSPTCPNGSKSVFISEI